MTEAINNKNLRIDCPLIVGKSLSEDSLDRQSFAEKVVQLMESVTAEAGLVVSIEGAWGCGKTSLLAMVEELLKIQPQDMRPIVVHFNPWIIGERDALLRQFLARIASAVKHTDYVKQGKQVAKRIKTYSKAFDVLKFVPGVEPWFSILKSVAETAGRAGEAFLDYKTPDIEAHKVALEESLKNFPRKIIVIIDDIDRLYPTEVYEMVRIIKAVGNLPHVGYVLAWDEKYICSALGKLNVPYAASYLDKVVHVRLPVPPLSFSQRLVELDKGFALLPKDAFVAFSNTNERLVSLTRNGLSELMEHPRDIVRLFDVILVIEHGLRGEIHLADIIGMACLITKAPTVYELLRKAPQGFVGRRPGSDLVLFEPDSGIKKYSKNLQEAIDACLDPIAVCQLVHWLFPKTAHEEASPADGRVRSTNGYLADPDRLLVALHLSTRPNDVSLVKVKRFIFQKDERDSISLSLSEQNCVQFLDHILTILSSLDNNTVLDFDELAMDLGLLVEKPSFVKVMRNNPDLWLYSPIGLLENAIQKILGRLTPDAALILENNIISNEKTLSLAALWVIKKEMQAAKNIKGKRDKTNLNSVIKPSVLAVFKNNIKSASKSGEIFDKFYPVGILRVAESYFPNLCMDIFKSIESDTSLLDRFSETVMQRSSDSHKGTIYSMPNNPQRLRKYADDQILKQHARVRSQDINISPSVRAAWLALLEEKAFYAVDGAAVDD